MIKTPRMRIPIDLLDRYIAGECSAAEARAVEEWITGREDRAAILSGMRELKLVSGSLSPEEVDQAWNVLSRSLLDTQPAASRQVLKSDNSYLTSRSVAPGNRTRSTWAGVGIATVVALFAGALGGALMEKVSISSGFNASSSMTKTYATGKGQKATVQLTDGSRVTLAPLSQVDLSPDFASGTRTIKVRGAAYFEVTHNPAIPFIVKAGEAEVQVVGTSFSIESYDEQSPVGITVSQGKVAVRNFSIDNRNNQLSSTVLTQGESATVIPGSKEIRVSAADISQNHAWVNGELRFRQVSLREVANVLERWYSVAIVIPDSSIASQRVTATFGRESITDIVAQLTRALGARYVFDGSTVTILKNF